MIVKTGSTKGVFSPEVQKYIRDVQFPRLVKGTNLYYVATINSKDQMQRAGTKLWQLQFEKEADVILHNVFDEKEARGWLFRVKTPIGKESY